ncbi:unnamed protein product [Brachionus calyciflorus]|uniref:HECT-type E3 ubiquitin transferase n=1 Tax=Brachionus calyciflorus TaxID=104777 RepID=A0A813V4W8_9BILA|nr:unnamed protein product [Brachionus calyciflorus]
MIGTENSVENERKKKAKEIIEKFFRQLTQGCGRENCTNSNCASNPNFQRVSINQAAALAIQLAQKKATLCESMESNSKNMEVSDDNDDVVTSKSCSTTNLRASSASSSKDFVQSLEDALKVVSSGNQQTSNSINFINEEKIFSLIQKCKDNFKNLKKDKMETDDKEEDHKELIKSYEPLFDLIKKVFTDYNCVAESFKFERDKINMSTTSPCIPPFNIDFNSVRRTFSILMSINGLYQEIEEVFNQSIYPLCVSIQFQLKKPKVEEEEVNKILHALLVVNELPLLENPGYMDKFIKAFYSTWIDLSPEACTKIVKLWSTWSAEELRPFLYRVQQYLTLEIVTKNLDLPDDDDDEYDDEENESANKKAIYKNEGLIGAINYLRIIYYSSIYGGRLDCDDQIKKERELEELENLERTESNREENEMFDGSSEISYLPDPIEKILNIRTIDCRESKIPSSEFINETVNQFIDVRNDYVEYTKQMQNQELIQQGHKTKTKKTYFSFLSNPFCVTLTKKNLALFYDNKIKMMRERRYNIMMSLLEGRMPTPYFKIRLPRQNLLNEALSLIELQEQENPSILRKQLFIEFENEQGIDQGGISKEFFQLVIDELLNKGYTFFKYDDKSKYYWFTPCTIETQQEFKLVGILFGIAIYNNVLLDVQFPPVFFRKLMGKIGVLEDLMFSHPDLHQSLISLLEFEGSDEEFEETFMQTFQISVSDRTTDSLVSFNLKENGDQIPVTKSNRKEFVDLYADFILNKGIEDSFRAFKKGFMKLTYNSPLSRWFTPEELESLLCGTKVLDWKSLEKATNYDSGFEQDTPYIKNFWRVFEEFTDEEKKLFLKFTTGTDRCPHGGLAELKLTIARNGPDSDKLPTAHTCFNVLLLPEYSSKEKLKEKLLKAIQYSRGFGLS